MTVGNSARTEASPTPIPSFPHLSPDGFGLQFLLPPALQTGITGLLLPDLQQHSLVEVATSHYCIIPSSKKTVRKRPVFFPRTTLCLYPQARWYADIQHCCYEPGSPVRNAQRPAGCCNHEELNRLLTSTIMIRRLKKEVLSQLPPKRRQQVRHPSFVSDSQRLGLGALEARKYEVF